MAEGDGAEVSAEAEGGCVGSAGTASAGCGDGVESYAGGLSGGKVSGEGCSGWSSDGEAGEEKEEEGLHGQSIVFRGRK